VDQRLEALKQQLGLPSAGTRTAALPEGRPETATETEEEPASEDVVQEAEIEEEGEER
jgi:hypothetical protein